jgi:hypothetical protein
MRCPAENGDCNLQNYRNSGNRRNGILLIAWPRVRLVMNNLKRLVLGVLSSLLFTIGFARTADQLDPMSNSLSKVNTDTAMSGAPDCSTLCDIHDSNA